MSVNVEIDVYINDAAYVIDNSDYFKLESFLAEMQVLMNNNQFQTESYKSLKKTFTTFLRLDVKKTKIEGQKVNSIFHYYTY